MKTADLVESLARGEAALPPHVVARRYATALAPALLVSLAGVVGVLGLRPDLPAAAALPMFWVKLGFPLAIALLALAALDRLSRPGARAASAGSTWKSYGPPSN